MPAMKDLEIKTGRRIILHYRISSSGGLESQSEDIMHAGDGEGYFREH
jgi:hypothetical protein